MSSLPTTILTSADKMGYPRKIRDALFKKEDTDLHCSYDQYIQYYNQSLTDTTQANSARLRNYFRSKALRAAARENIYVLNPILFSRLARCDEEDAKQPPGGLEEDWEEYTINK